MNTEKTWEQFYKENKGIYSSGHFTDRDDPDGRIYNEYQITYREQILHFAGPEKIALELGCGNKPIFDALGRFASIYYTDISKEALDAAKLDFKKLEEISGVVIFQEMNVESFNFEDESLDVVFNTRAPHREETSRELVRTLKPGGSYVYQTIGEEDNKDLKLLFKAGRFYEDYLLKGVAREQVLRESLTSAGFEDHNISTVFDKHFKNFFESKDELKNRLWLIVGDLDFDSEENNNLLDQYIDTHTDDQGRIWTDNHRIILKAIK